MINAIKKILQGETAFTLTDLGSGTISSAEIAGSAITGAKVATDAISALHIVASGVGRAELKYSRYVFSFAGDGSAGPGNGASAAISVVVNGGAAILGFYLTKFVCTSAASYVNTITIASTTSTCFTLSPAYGLKSTADVIEGVLVTIE
jgi:hypothetical protein